MNNISLKPWSVESKAIDLIQEVAQLFAEHDLCFGHGTDNPLDEANALIFFVLGIDNLDAEALSSKRVSHEDYECIRELVNQRIYDRKPLAYLIKKLFFVGISFMLMREYWFQGHPLPN